MTRNVEALARILDNWSDALWTRFDVERFEWWNVTAMRIWFAKKTLDTMRTL